MKKLPKKLYVTWKAEEEGGWFQANTTPDELPDFNETITVGVYELKEIKKAINKTELK